MDARNHRMILRSLVTVLTVVFAMMWASFAVADKAAILDDFDECVAAGNPVMESFPRRCRSANKTFTEDVGNAMLMADQIRVRIANVNEGVLSPLEIKGEARGDWFVNGAFQVRLIDILGKEIATTTAKVEGDFGPDDFVPFTAVSIFASSAPERAVLVFEKGNPTGGAPEGERLILPVRLLGRVPVGEPEKTVRAFTRHVTLSVGDVVQFSDGLFLRLTAIEEAHCPSRVRCLWADGIIADFELSGGDLGPSITDVRLGEEAYSETALKGYDFKLAEATRDEISLAVPVNLMAVVLRYDSRIATLAQ